MKQYLPIGLLVAVAGCATPSAVVSWVPEPYGGFKESIDALAGAAAIDCGFVRSPGRKISREQRSAFRCVADSVKRGVPFKYGALIIPIDSFAYKVLVRSPDGKFHLIVYDVMIDNSFAQEWRNVCERIALDARYADYEGESCEAVRAGT